MSASQCREYKEGWQGRRRYYWCLSCGQKFMVDTRVTLPQKSRLCDECITKKQLEPDMVSSG